MRSAALALALSVLAGTACGRRALQKHDGGTGTIPVDAAGDALSGVDAPAAIDVRPPTTDANCGIKTYRFERLPTDVMLVVDRAFADRAKWSQFVLDFTDLTGSLDREIAWGLKLFPENGPACGAGTVSPRIDVPIAEQNSSRVIGALAGATPDGSGTPTAAAVEMAVDAFASVVDQNPKLVLLVTDGAPTCAGAAGAVTSDAARALTDAETRLRLALGDGYPTLVVGVGISAQSDVDALNRLAQAGGFPRTVVNEAYYPSSNVNELRAVLTPIHDTSCIFSLTPPPPEGVAVVVSIDGVTIPYDPSHRYGWDYVTAGHTAFSFYGEACDTIAQSWEFELQILYGCLAI
jgi:hypothetical protein